jgi:hypothetical protein
VRPMSLVFTFELELDDRKLRVTNRAGDAVRMRGRHGGDGLDKLLADRGTGAYEVMFEFAWMALRHHDEYRDLAWEDFLDRCEQWSIVPEEESSAADPTVAGPSSEP